MPASPTYGHRIPAALDALRQSTCEWIDRRQLGALLGVSKTVAWRVLRHCGGEAGPGGALVCGRAALIDRLEELRREGGPLDLEIRRHNRLADFLQQIRPQVLAHLTDVARDEQALEMLSSRFQSLPANVVLTRSSLHIDFSGANELLEAVGTLIYALHNDFERIRDYIEGDAQPSPGRAP